MSTLCIADALNFLDSIEAIAKDIHSKNQSSSAATACSSTGTNERSENVLDCGDDSTAGHTERTSDDDDCIQSSGSSINDSLVVDTGKVSADFKQEHKDTELEEDEFRPSEVRTKPNISHLFSRQKKRVKNHQAKKSHRQHTESAAPTPSKQSKRKHKQLLLYGMGAGCGYEQQ